MNDKDDIRLLQANVLAAPYRIDYRLNLAQAYERSQYPDLAAGEVYLALLLIDEARDESGEYHEYTVTATKHAISADFSDPDNIEREKPFNSRSPYDKMTDTDDTLSTYLNTWSSNA